MTPVLATCSSQSLGLTHALSGRQLCYHFINQTIIQSTAWSHPPVLRRWASEQAKFRPLRLSLLSLLGVRMERVPPSALFSPAARLLEDLQPKLKHAFAKPRPAVFQIAAKLLPGT